MTSSAEVELVILSYRVSVGVSNTMHGTIVVCNHCSDSI